LVFAASDLQWLITIQPAHRLSLASATAMLIAYTVYNDSLNMLLYYKLLTVFIDNLVRVFIRQFN